MSNPYYNLVMAESSLIHYWPLYETSGTTAYDVVSSGAVNGTIGGTSPPTLGHAGIPAGGTSYLFNGSGSNSNVSYVETGTFAAGTSTFAVEAWVYLPGYFAGVYPAICGWYLGSTYSGDLYLTPGTPGGFQYYLYDGGAKTGSASGVSSGAWRHLFANIDGSVAMNLYVDGVKTAGPSIGTPYNTSNGLPWWIGSSGSTSGYVDASFPISNVAIYGANLSDTDVLLHYTTGITGGSTGNPAALLPAM